MQTHPGPAPLDESVDAPAHNEVEEEEVSEGEGDDDSVIVSPVAPCRVRAVIIPALTSLQFIFFSLLSNIS